MAPSLYFTYNDESRVFEGVSLWAKDSWTVTGLAEPEQVRGLSVSPEFLHTLGVPLELGRGFTAADQIPEAGASSSCRIRSGDRTSEAIDPYSVVRSVWIETDI
jgi:hypothetical protein